MREKHYISSRLSALYASIIPVMLIYLYFPVLRGLAADWMVNDNYSHGWFIPLISGAMIYRSRRTLRKIRPQPCNPGFFVLAAGLLLYVIAKTGNEFFGQRISLLVVLVGLILFLLGWEFFRRLLVPLLYLLFMIPLPAILWNRIAFPLQLFSSWLTEQVVSLLGITMLRQGNMLVLPDITLEVAAACSGLRSLNTMFALAGALAFFSAMTPLKKWLLFFSAAPIAILANIIRLTMTVLLATWYGTETAHGFQHEFSGLLVFIMGLGMLYGVQKQLEKHQLTENGG